MTEIAPPPAAVRPRRPRPALTAGLRACADQCETWAGMLSWLSFLGALGCAIVIVVLMKVQVSEEQEVLVLLPECVLGAMTLFLLLVGFYLRRFANHMGNVSRRQLVASLADGFAAQNGFWRVAGGTTALIFLLSVGAIVYTQMQPDSFASLQHDLAATIADSKPKPQPGTWRPPKPVTPPPPASPLVLRVAALAFAVVGAVSVIQAFRD